MDVLIGGKRVRLTPRQLLGSGGEADVYDLGNGRVAKVWKPPDHPDFASDQRTRQAVADRLAAYAQKLRDFPPGLPPRVVAPVDLVADTTGRKVLGYTMPFIGRAEVLFRFTDRSARTRGITPDTVREIFLDLHGTVRGLHGRQVIIGDFNDLNVLVMGTNAHLIDADSFQFGRYPCPVFTARFLDPLLCDPNLQALVLARPYTEGSDWYAYAVMLMQCLLFVGPYGGISVPPKGKRPIPHDARPLQRITIFHPSVRYPKPGVPPDRLPDDLLHAFQEIFIRDRRGEFPRSLLEDLRWTKCRQCGEEHARLVCPSCQKPTLPVRRAPTTVRGRVRALEIFETAGVIVAAAVHGGRLRWLSHASGRFLREDGSAVLAGDLTPDLAFHLLDDCTVIAGGGQFVVLGAGREPVRGAVDMVGGTPASATNEEHVYWVSGGRLLRDGPLGDVYVGEVLEGRTRIWAGPTFGFGFATGGNLSLGFLFDAEAAGINDRVALPRLRGHLIATDCVFSAERCWFFAELQRGGRRSAVCLVLRRDGTVEAAHEAPEPIPPWLAVGHGKCAVSTFLLAATDDGIVRVEPDQGRFTVTKTFPDTEPFTEADNRLLPLRDGLAVVAQQKISVLQMS